MKKQLERKSSNKFLGVMLDQIHHSKDHIDAIEIKFAKKIVFCVKLKTSFTWRV